MTRLAATLVSWLLWPVVVIVLGWRWAMDRAREPLVTIIDPKGAYPDAIVTLRSGRDLACSRISGTWRTSGHDVYGCRTMAPAWIANACDLALIRARNEVGL